jgi:hypothetical protein
VGFWFWVLGVGFWVSGPNPQSPIPNPQSPIPNALFKNYNIFKYKNNKNKNIILITKYKNVNNKCHLINTMKNAVY